MFDLDQRIAEWRQAMADAGLENPAIISELEEHLRQDIEQQVRSGTSAPVAFEAALERIGKPGALKSEFDIVASRGALAALRQHQWKVLLCGTVGLIAAAAVHLSRPPPYHSEAKLLVRYVIVEQPSQPSGAVAPPRDASLTTAGPIWNERLATVMAEQFEILGSEDLATQVAAKIGPAKLLRKAGGGSDLVQAARVVRQGLSVHSPWKSTVIRMAFRHPDSSLVQPVLRQVIEEFLKLHVEMHRANDRVRQEAGPAATPMELGLGRVSNLSQIQSPSAPISAFGKSIAVFALLVGAGLLAGLGWVFLSTLHEEHSDRYRPEVG
jgi:hypothetical protein